jgi:uncharacterized protein YbjT (DUF2867 family)
VSDTLVLVTGANGFIASRLIPRLLAGGYRVRALARRPERLAGRTWLPRVDTRAGSTTAPGSLAAALDGVHTTFYLIHSMSSGRGYIKVERESAATFARAAEAAGVQHIVYLGGLADPNDPRIAPHMRSRIETGEVLRQGRVPVTEFRAGVITGAGSISFEMIRFLTEFFPILPGPTWLRNQSQPIASENVIDYLMAGLQRPDVRGGIFEMGGPERMRYSDTMLRYARFRGLRRHLFTLPGIPIWFMAIIVDWLTPVPYPIATALVGGLQSDSQVNDETAQKVFPEVKLIRYEQAIEAALKDLKPERLERVWEGLGGDAANFRHEGFIIDYRRRAVHAPAATVFDRLVHMGGRNRWPYADWIWRLRGLADNLTSNRASRHAQTGMISKVGDEVDYYRVEALVPDRLLRLFSTLRAPGDGWLEWRVEAQTPATSLLTQTALFAPHGLPGFIYWFALGPMHRFVFRGMIGAIKRSSEA